MGRGPARAEDEVSLRDDLLPEWAIQYYVAGRLAARTMHVPVYGSILDHAVEMFMKAALTGRLGATRTRAYGHDLDKLWQRYKAENADPELNRFDSTIRALNEFEELRYPDKIPHAAIFMAITWKPSHAAKSYSTKPSHQYEVFISDVDKLVIDIMDRIPLNPKVFTGGGRLRRSGRGALRYQNPRAARWL